MVTASPESPYVCVSLGVGNNQSKRMPAAFEARLLRILGDTGCRLVIDAGAGGAEGAAVRAAIAAAGLQDAQVQVLEGSFAAFCRVIQGARFYVGYDSAGQHAAAALGVPGITLFKGFANEKMFQRWQPRAVPGGRVIRVSPETTEPAVESQFTAAVLALL
jgi:ADP-heptose:LPS heptosyltransferase